MEKQRVAHHHINPRIHNLKVTIHHATAHQLKTLLAPPRDKREI